MSRLRLHVDGEHGAVSFRAFVDVLNRARLILSELDGAISEEPQGVLTWTITDLGVNSADAVIEAKAPAQGYGRVPELVTSNFVGGLQTVAEGEHIPAYFSERSLKRVKTISNKIGKGGVTGFTATDLDHDQTAEITETAGASVRKLLAPRYTGDGSVLGTLGLISVRKNLTFNVYDELTHRAVRCRFEDDQFEEVREALRRRVIVAGTVHRNANGEPLSVEGPEITVLPTTEKGGIPTSEIIGIDPDFTGGSPSGEYVRDLRD